MNKKIIRLIGVLAVSCEKGANTYVQFLPDEPETIELEGLTLKGTAQLLRNGQFEFVASMSNQLNNNQL